MQDLNDLYYFVQSVEHGGFAPAGRALGIAKSKLSRRIALLEDRLGVRLLQRSTRHFIVTEVGQRYYEHCRAMLVEANAAQQLIDELAAEPAGVVRLTCPVGLLHFHVSAMLSEFMLRYPKVQVHLEATNRRADVMAEGLDLALRARPLPLEDSELILKVLSDRGQCLVAAPSLIAQYGTPQDPDDLSLFPAMSRARPEEIHSWQLCHADGTQVNLTFTPRYITTDMLTLKMAALAGVGIVQLPQLMLTTELADGRLIRLLPDWEPRREVIHLVYPSRRGQLPSVRALIDFFAEKYQTINEN
ncbi:LysR family transcriptional regulator [Rheinheimera soli]|uniref:DNA-binding transcriptional LysR family regulator n=1 Tax=Rheinheimera soli TaxID=443616 RepID=A0ABU1W4P1_9GAMM|nr:LysR family transcriptional regulator [Rheinheimera soli]MDR7122708.1 DNA-binding transcriptional LysR family regulator [Rheinheimera soli]